MSLALSNNRFNPEVLNFTEKLNQVLKANKLLQKKTKTKTLSEIKAVKPKQNKISLISNIYNNINNINSSEVKIANKMNGEKKMNKIQDKRPSYEQTENYYRIEKILEKSVTKLVKPKEEQIDLSRQIIQIPEEITLEEDNSDNYEVEELDSSSETEIDLSKNKKDKKDENELINKFFNFNKNTTNIHNINSFSNNINVINSINAINQPRKYQKKFNYNNFHKTNSIQNSKYYSHRKNLSNNQNPHFLQKNITKKNNKPKEIKNKNPEDIQKEFYEITTSEVSIIDKYIKCINFFFQQGFSEDVRFLFYETLMNLGLPINGNFNTFYQNFVTSCNTNQTSIPCQITTEYYLEFIINILLEKISESKKNFISKFFFDGDNYDFIKNNFNLIAFVRELISENEFKLYNFIMDKYDILFKNINIRMNIEFIKYKSVIAKMLSNIIIKCDKSGYLNFRQYIEDDNIIFKGLKIRDNQFYNYNYGIYDMKKMICIKIFGLELTNERFNEIISEFFLYLFSHFNYNNIIQM